MKRPLVIVDRYRLRQFAQLARTRGLFAETSRTTATDESGDRWAVARVGDDAFAVPALGPGWVFDPALATLRAKALDELRERVRTDADRTLRDAIGTLQLGGRCERVLWSLHRHLVAARRSVFRVPDVTIATDVYGPDATARPAHWRSDLLAILTGLTRLHIGECDGASLPTFGTATVLLNAVADLRGQPGDVCGSDCPLHGHGTHHHFQINAGRGFLGALERLAGTTDATGTREYDFNRTSGGETLSTVGKSGRVTEVFFPAVLAEPAARNVLSPGQRDILQAILRERTRARQGRRARGPARPEVVTGGRVRKVRGVGLVVCPDLDATRRYCGFNGNGIRRGRGYLLTTPGGWLVKAGYTSDQLEQFLTDLVALAQTLGLVLVAMDPAADPVWIDPQRLAALARTAPGRTVLHRSHLRVFAEEGWEERWTRVFVKSAPEPAIRETTNLAGDLAALPLSRRQLAADLKVDPSFLTKVLNGKKPCPTDLAVRAREYLSAREKVTSAPDVLAALWSGAGISDPVGGSFAEVAAPLVARGWSVVPVRTGEKKPCVKWKPYRDRRPTTDEVQAWSQRWPDAGTAVVLGPVSGLFVIDVDGPEAHAALVERLGSVPTAPLAVSGSRAPYRYHLYFQHPKIKTGAKATPWHPKLEFRGEGGLAVTPPSPHASGRRYAWAPGRSSDELPLPELPPLVLAALTRRAAHDHRPSAASVQVGLTPTALLASVSDSTREFLSGKWSEGPGWNDRLFLAACDLQSRGVPETEATPLLLAGARPWDDTQAAMAVATIRSAYSRPRVPAKV